MYFQKRIKVAAVMLVVLLFPGGVDASPSDANREMKSSAAVMQREINHDVSAPLASLHGPAGNSKTPDCLGSGCGTSPSQEEKDQGPVPSPAPEIPAAGRTVEQTAQGKRPPVPLVESFDGLGEDFHGPQGTAKFRNPSDNSLAVGPDHIVQTVNSRLAVFSKKGKRYDQTGTVLYGPVATNNIFAGFGGACDERISGDAVVRYDQLADRWLIVIPMFSPILPGQFSADKQAAPPGQASSPGAAAAPPANPPEPPERHRSEHPPAPPPERTYAMCYAVSTTADPLGPYYRYAFERRLFPDYPRPAVWPDGYYLPTSTGDDVVQKHVCIADRNNMLAGKPATEQCIVIDGVNFLNNADVDGRNLPPPGAPNIMMAAGGTQLKKIFEDDGIYAWKVHVDWQTPANTKAFGPEKIPVAPYHYLCDGQLSHCVPQPGTDVRLDAQGDKIMQRLVYRRIGRRESVVAAHSVSTAAGAGGVRWYEFRLNKQRDPKLYQQGTFAPDGFYRWMPSIAMDKKGNIGVGYSFGGTPHFAGQRFAARLEKDPKGMMGFEETVLAEGEAAQTNTFRWEDYSTTAIDPSDDCTFWYVGDYLKKGATDYSTRIGWFRVPGCK